MKIAIITPVFPPYLAGMGNVAAREAEGLAKKGHDVAVLTPLYSKSSGIKIEEELNGCKVHRLKGLIQFGNAALLFDLGKELNGFGIIHFHYPFIGGVKAVLRFKKKNPRVPLIVTYHMDLTGQGWKRLFFTIYTRLTLPRVIQSADKILVSSFDYARQGRLKEYLKKYPEKFVEVPFGIDIGCHPRESGDPAIIISSKAEKSLDSRFRGNDNKIILFVGGLDKAHYFKGVDILLKSFQKFCYMLHVTCYMLIVGDGDLRPYYEKQARRLGIVDKVMFAGRVSPEDLPTYYQLADVFVLPSLDSSEAYGLVLLEAMSYAVPIIASDLPGVRTLIRPEWGRLVMPGSADDLVRALKEIFSDENKLRAMGEAAKRWVFVNRFIDEEINKLDNVFQSC